jgi:hypothetical protein
MDTAGASFDNLDALDAAIVSAKRILEQGGALSSTDTGGVVACKYRPARAAEASSAEVVEPKARGACNGGGCCG